ncbi:MAG: thiolase family protein [Clostridium sp.]
MKTAVIVSVARTPIAKYRGDFAALTVPELGSIVIKAAVEKIGLDPVIIDEIIFGNIFGSDWGNPARACVLQAGFSEAIPAITVDRQCGSALSALGIAASAIQAGMADVILTGGVESYSQQPYYIKQPNRAYAPALDVQEYKTSIPGGSGDNIPMIQTAENLAERYQLTREECDAFALTSHKKAAIAVNNGWFDDQIVPVSVPQRKGEPKVVTADACVRFDASIELLSKLKTVSGRPNGVVTAGNSSPQNDGATAVLVMSAEKAAELNLEPLAVVREYCAAGCDPTIMGIGPVYSSRKLMARYGYKNEDFDLIELNEAFAAQAISCIKEMNWDMEKINVEGGAIAIGHPNGASGGMLVGRMVYALRRRSLKRGLVTFCCGGGQGISLVLENPLV